MYYRTILLFELIEGCPGQNGNLFLLKLLGFSYYCKGRLCKKFIWKLSKRIIQEEKKTKSCGNHRCPIDWVLFRKALSFD